MDTATLSFEFTPTTIGLFRKAKNVYRAFDHQLRQQILQELWENEVSVTDLYVKLRLPQSVASQMLAILRRANLVIAKRSGKQILYTADVNRVKQLQMLAEAITS